MNQQYAFKYYRYIFTMSDDGLIFGSQHLCSIAWHGMMDDAMDGIPVFCLSDAQVMVWHQFSKKLMLLLLISDEDYLNDQHIGLGAQAQHPSL
jgi:hypothetical protein